ncbi:uncharacterized protein TM35_000035200 [Trypanosoma theileri]|uniref:RanBP2-type domain-containing protein n=1 Tax=Trypanosoma theileri TaxID=67003 RepID=A0A1X0P744_9TRYP|nr:uncharacterized protein TM35_000035200 [Trypanosoma theileri]ORC92767.1 hypothetical protein TM35_000035200 [Trypanosoma theileri]
MWRWNRVSKRRLLLRNHLRRFPLLEKTMVVPEERLVFERELLDGSRGISRASNSNSSSISIMGLSHSFYPFAVFALRGGMSSNLVPDDLWPLLLLAINTTDVSLELREACLFSGTSVYGYYCVRRAIEVLKNVPFQTSSCGTSTMYMKLVVSLIDSTSSVDEGKFMEEFKKFRLPIPCHILQILLSGSLPPSILTCIVTCELEKFKDGITPEFFNASMNGLLSNDNFFSPLHFDEMNLILTNIIDKIQSSSFDFLSVHWTPLLNKMSRIYMRQCQGEALVLLHSKLLTVIPELEAKLPLLYLLRCMGSLVDASALKEDASYLWIIIVDIASFALRLHGSVVENLRSIWVLFFKAAVTLKPKEKSYSRIFEAYHVFASLGHPITLEKASFSQLTRYLVSSIGSLTLDEISLVLRNFYQFLKEHPSVSFLWITDALIAILSEIWTIHGEAASPFVQNLIRNLEEDYFPSMRLSGIYLANYPAIRLLLENFKVVKKAEFWWCCGCGANLPSSAKKCLICLRRCNISWTCVTCGAQHKTMEVNSKCLCGSVNPRTREAAERNIHLCTKCGDVVPSLNVCTKCETVSKEQYTLRLCSFCKKLYSQQSICCPHCYTANQDKQPILWRCDSCEEYNQWTWSKCQRCPAKRKVGCITFPLNPWVCGCGARNHPCRIGCEQCFSCIRGGYTCNSCGLVSNNHGSHYVVIGSQKLRLITCEHCKHVHPRDCNILSSPFLPRHCHKCGVEYTGSDTSGNKDHCTFCNALLCYNELNPFLCSRCEFPSPQCGFNCSSCGAPRGDIVAGDFFVWRCHREVPVKITTMESKTQVCGHWNYSWSNHCTFCGESRAYHKHECRARFVEWVCSSCDSRNFPTDVLLCPSCDNGLQIADDCSICGSPHLCIECTK